MIFAIADHSRSVIYYQEADHDIGKAEQICHQPSKEEIFTMGPLFWSGPRESDIYYTDDMFDGSVTFYGSGKNGNRSFCQESHVRIEHNASHPDASDFILSWQLQKIREYPDCRFMSYNPNCLTGAPDEIIEHTLCLNDADLMRRLNDKLEFRKLAEGIVPLLDARESYGRDCTYESLSSRPEFSGYDAFIVQELIASGGHGTFYLTGQDEEEILRYIDGDSRYLVSGYVWDNIPVNMHVVIFDRDIVLLPGSIQVIQNVNDRLLYRGADFIAYRDIPEKAVLEWKQLSLRLSRKIQALGYRGVLGIDAMLAGDQIYFLEINNRFQGSSIVLNRALSEKGLPSLQRMDQDAFYSSDGRIGRKRELEELEVPYSLYIFINEGDGVHSRHMYQAVQREKTVAGVISEGDPFSCRIEDLAYQFAVIFSTDILSLCDGGTCVRLHPNVCAVPESWDRRIRNGDLSALKTSLINRGAVLSKAAIRYIEAHGKMREGTYFSLDIYLSGIYVNCPLSVKMASLSPFLIDMDQEADTLCLKFYGRYLAPIQYDRKWDLLEGKLHDGTPLGQICFLATDRLRLQNNPFCTFPEHGLGCSFCEAGGIHNHFGVRQILEAIDLLFRQEDLPFRHILIGGLSNDIGKEKEVILQMCARIRRYTDMPVYLMCLPPSAKEVEMYHRAGVTEFGFNLEIYDRALARKYMPGKGCIPLHRYLEAFEAAVACAGDRGAVRCAFIVGLEPESSLLEGIEEVCKRGVAPVLSVFRPIPGTTLQDRIPPSDEWLYGVMEKAEEICARYRLTLGPECPACRNNTLTLAQPGEAAHLRLPL